MLSWGGGRGLEFAEAGKGQAARRVVCAIATRRTKMARTIYFRRDTIQHFRQLLRQRFPLVAVFRGLVQLAFKLFTAFSDYINSGIPCSALICSAHCLIGPRRIRWLSHLGFLLLAMTVAICFESVSELKLP